MRLIGKELKDLGEVKINNGGAVSEISVVGWLEVEPRVWCIQSSWPTREWRVGSLK